jgi:serine protease Do
MASRLKNIGRELSEKLARNSRLRLVLIFLLPAGMLVGAALLVYRFETHRLRYERSLLRLSTELQSDRLSQRELERRLAEAKEEMERRGKRMDEVESRLSAATRKVEELERERRTGESAIRKYLGGVAFVEIAYTFEDRKGQRIRFEKVDSSGEPVTDAAGETAVAIGAAGPVVHIRSSGTGFLIKENKLLTNRHVVEPWLQNKAAGPFLTKGFRPVRTLFRAFFPGVKGAFIMQPVRISKETDLALLEFDAKGAKLPVLEFESDPKALSVGRAVLLIGYPAGVESLLARVDAVTLKKIRDLRGNKVVTITEDLSERGLIRPLVTWGHLSEVREHQLTYDALTTSGGSGSPIFNTHGKVIGVNQAMLKSFTGSSFGIPARRAAEFIASGK